MTKKKLSKRPTKKPRKTARKGTASPLFRRFPKGPLPVTHVSAKELDLFLERMSYALGSWRMGALGEYALGGTAILDMLRSELRHPGTLLPLPTYLGYAPKPKQPVAKKHAPKRKAKRRSEK